MKQIKLLISFLLLSIAVNAQFPSGTDTLRRYNNRFIDNDPKKAFTNLRLHNLLEGIINHMDTMALGGGSIQLGMDTLWADNDSTLIYRKNGLFHTVIIRGSTGAGPIYRVPFSDGNHLTNDSNFLFDYSQGSNATRLIVGPTAISSGGLAKINATSDNMNAAAFTAYGTGLNTIVFRRALGTVGLPLTLTQGSDLWNFSGRGYTGTVYTTSRAAFYAQTAQAWTDSTQGTRLYFATTPNDSITMQTRMIIDDSLQVSVAPMAMADSVAALTRNANGLVTVKMVPNTGSGNLATKSLTANGAYSHNWSYEDLSIDSIKTLNLVGRGLSVFGQKRVSQVYMNATNSGDGGTFMAFKSARRNAADNADSITHQLYYDLNGINLQFSSTAANNNTRLFMNGRTINLIAADSINMGKIPIVATADTLLAVGAFNSSLGVNGVVKIPASAIGGGSTTWPQALTNGRLFSGNDSSMHAGNTFGFKDLSGFGINTNRYIIGTDTTLLAIKGSVWGNGRGNRYIINATDSGSRAVFNLDHSGRINLFDHSGQGSVMVLYNKVASGSIAGHYAFGGANDAGNLNTLGTFYCMQDVATASAVTSRLTFGYSDAVNTTGGYMQPNKTMELGVNGLTLPGIPLNNPTLIKFNGTTTPGWTTSGRAGLIQAGDIGLFFGTSADFHFASNGYYDGAWKYVSNGKASNQFMYEGEVYHRVTTSGSANGTITWATALKSTHISGGAVGIGGNISGTSGSLAGATIIAGPSSVAMNHLAAPATSYNVMVREQGADSLVRQVPVSVITGQLKNSTTWDPASIGANSSTTTTLTVTGAALGDGVIVSKTSGSFSNGELYFAYVSATNTVTIQLQNVSGGTFDIASATFNVIVTKY